MILKLDVLYRFYKSYFPYDQNNGTWSSKCNEKNKFVKNCEKTEDNILRQIENSQVVITLKYWTDYGKNYMLFSLNFA